MVPSGKNRTWRDTTGSILKREIMEELDTEIVVGDLIDTIEYDYPDFLPCPWIASGARS